MIARRDHRLSILSGCVLIFVALFALSPAFGQTRPSVDIRGEQNEGFGRIVMDWPGPAPTPEIQTVDNVLIVQFADPFTADLRDLRSALGDYIALARQDSDGRTLRFALKIAPRIETSGQGRRLAIDLIPPSFDGARVPLEAAPLTPAPSPLAEAGEAPVAPPEPEGDLAIRVGSDDAFTRLVFEWSEPTTFDYDRDGDRLVFSFAHKADVSLAPLQGEGVSFIEGAERLDGPGTRIAIDVEPRTRVDVSAEGKIVLADLRPGGGEIAEIAPRQDPEAWVERGGEVEAHIVETKPDPETEFAETHADGAHEPVADEASAEPEIEQLAVEAEETAQGLRIHFPWSNPATAAVFARGDHLWVVFGSPAEIDLSAIGRRHRGWVREAESFDLEEGSAVRLLVAGDLLATAESDGTAWTVILGDAILTASKPLGFERDRGKAGEPVVRIPFPGVEKTLWLEDPEVGDALGIAVAPGPAQGFVAPRRLADFTLLTTAHGVAVEARAEDLSVTVREDAVVVGKSDGLTLTEEPGTRRVTARSPRGPKREPGFIDFQGWKRPDMGDYSASKQMLMVEAAAASGNTRTAARLELARFYLAHELNAEALGMLDLVAAEDETALQNPAFRALRGVTNYLLARDEEALDDLTVATLEKDGSAGLWRGLAYTRLLRWSDARSEFNLGRKALALYAPESQARFRLAEARAALELNDLAAAEETLLAMPKDTLNKRRNAEAQFLRGRLAAGVGDSEGALTAYEAVVEGGVMPFAVEAAFEKARLLLKVEAASLVETIEALENLRYRWRGDTLELSILNELGQLYIQAGQPRTGLETMRSAVTYFPRSPLSRGIADEMAAIFEELFLEGGADAFDPVQALGIYYDFRELTPIGRKGDLMIRKMADRLVQVDLLPQAAELLEHQMRYRLKGVAKAQVAARLSMVQLLDRNAEEALRALEQSRQALLPNALARQRRLLRAQALSALGRHEHALELLEDDSGEDVGRLRAGILWEAEDWPASAKASEDGLGDVWRGGAALDGSARAEVMRAAIAYSLASDEEGLARIRRKFAPGMSQSPDAQAFEVVTAPIDRQGVEFRELVGQIAASDAFETFMRSLRAEFDTPEPEPGL